MIFENCLDLILIHAVWHLDVIPKISWKRKLNLHGGAGRLFYNFNYQLLSYNSQPILNEVSN